MITKVPETKEELLALGKDYDAAYTLALSLETYQGVKNALYEVDRIEKLFEQANCWLDENNELVKEDNGK